VSIGAIVLAAGASRRLGQAKQLVIHHGEELVRHTLRAAAESRCTATCVVLGANADHVMPAVLGIGAEVVHNPAWETGMASSIAAGVAWAERRGHDAIVLCVCDQPHLSAAHLNALIHEHETTGDVIASRYHAAVGVPVVFPRASFPALLALTGDQGARGLLRTGIVRVVAWDAGAVDVDTPQDLDQLRAVDVGPL
jgi:molybdenum cofactor cytidylyltransferase